MITYLENRNKNYVNFFIFQVVLALICLSSEKNLDSLSPAGQQLANKSHISFYDSFHLTAGRQGLGFSWCIRDQFLCKSQDKCIKRSLLCDGINDCPDSSDETAEECEAAQFVPPPLQFKCKYGACISSRYKCDGITHCLDGSDEFDEVCGTITKAHPITGPRITPQTPNSAPGSCILPRHSPDKNFTVNCPENYKCSEEPGKKVPKFTEIAFQCNPDYAYADGDLKSYCLDGTWIPRVVKCRNCGKTFAKFTSLTNTAVDVSYEDSPWNVAIYKFKGNAAHYSCGGTIISPHLIVSGAYQFYDRMNSKPYAASDFEAIVSKMTKSYTVQDNLHTKKYRIRQIFFYDKGYYEDLTNYAADITLLWVAEKITFSRAVMPACIQWSHHSFEPADGTLGKVVSFSAANIEQNATLEGAQVPYISYKTCLKMVNDSLKNLITEKKFCVGSGYEPAVFLTDLGIGLLFRDQNTGLYFLRGVSTITDLLPNSMDIYVDLSQYIDWISSVHEQVENARS